MSGRCRNPAEGLQSTVRELGKYNENILEIERRIQSLTTVTPVPKRRSRQRSAPSVCPAFQAGYSRSWIAKDRSFFTGRRAQVRRIGLNEQPTISQHCLRLGRSSTRSVTPRRTRLSVRVTHPALFDSAVSTPPTATRTSWKATDQRRSMVRFHLSFGTECSRNSARMQPSLQTRTSI